MRLRHRPLPLASLSLASLLGCATTGRDPRTRISESDPRPYARSADGTPVDEPAMNSAVEGWAIAHRQVLHSSERCVSSPIEVYIPARRVDWVRSIRLQIHAPRRLAFHIDIHSAEERDRRLGASTFGLDPAEHEAVLRGDTACVAQAASIVTPTTGTTTAGTTTTAGGSTTTVQTTTTTTATATATPAVAMTVSAEAPLRGLVSLGDIPADTSHSLIVYEKEFVLERALTIIPMNQVHRSWVPTPRLEGAIIVRIWTQEPMDFQGAVIELNDLLLEPRIPRAEYTRLMARRVEAGVTSQRDFDALCREHPEDTRCYNSEINRRRYVGATRPPPPLQSETRPAQPTPEHVWVAGGWQWNRTDYVWIAGMWRFVPPAVVAAAAGSNATTSTTPAVATRTTTTTTATFSAPAAAVVIPTSTPARPPPRPEQIPPAPQAGANWIAGYWQWDGGAWAWAPGHWQMPPASNVRWAPPAVQVNTGGVQLFLPGGWIQIGL